MRTNLKQPVMRNFDRQTIVANGPNNIWAIDLVDFSDRAKERADYVKTQQLYVLNAVDVFSRYAQSVKVSGKDVKTIQVALTKLFELFGAKPQKLWCDMESSVVSLESWLSQQNIELYHVNNSYNGPNTHSVAIVERFNRTFRDAVNEIQVIKPMNQSTAISYAIKLFIQKYNYENKHRTIGTTPASIYHGKVHLDDALNNQAERAREPKFEPKQDLHIGQKVYLQLPKEVIVNKHDAKYFDEPFTISKINPTNPTTYELEEIDNASFYRQQFILTAKDKVNKKSRYDLSHHKI